MRVSVSLTECESRSAITNTSTATAPVPAITANAGHATGRQVLDNLGLEGVTHAVQLAQAPLLEQYIHAFGRVRDAPRRRAVGVVAERRLALDLEDVADLGEQSRNFRVGAGARTPPRFGV